MANSRIEVVNNNVLSYVDSVFNEYTTHVTCPKDVESYKEWFTGAFLPCCITRWYEPSCYDINNMFTIEQFFDHNIYIFSDIGGNLINNNLILQTNGTDTIAGQSSFTANINYSSIQIISNIISKWLVI
jgi:hypothetical protein